MKESVAQYDCFIVKVFYDKNPAFFIIMLLSVKNSFGEKWIENEIRKKLN
jgi:hypothetical protein